MYYVAISAFLSGVGLATLFSIPFSTILFVALLGVIVAVIQQRHRFSVYRVLLTGLALVLVGVSFGALRTEWASAPSIPPPYAERIGTETVLSGIVVREPDVRARTVQLYVESYDERILVSVDRHHEVAYGDEVLISGRLERPEAFETDLGRTFDYPGYLLARGVLYRMSFADIAVLSSGNGNPAIATLLTAKHFLMRNIESVIPEPQAGLAEGLLLGVKQALGDDIEEAFRKSGIIHIVVLSGYNVMLVVAFFMFFLAPLPRWVRLVAGIATITGFALLVGLSATVVRASIMAGIFLFAETLRKRYDVMRILFSAGAVMVFLNPYLLLYDIGFQLSFMATLGLLLVTPHFETSLQSGQAPQWREYVLATIATQIAVLPLLLYHIGEVSLVAVIVNLLVLPVVPLAMLGGFLVGILASVLPAPAVLIAYPTNLLLFYIISAATFFAGLPLSTLVVPPFSPLLIPLLYGVTFFLYRYFLSRRGDANSIVASWEIVDETTLEKKGTTDPVAPEDNDDVPIFFR